MNTKQLIIIALGLYVIARWRGLSSPPSAPKVIRAEATFDPSVMF